MIRNDDAVIDKCSPMIKTELPASFPGGIIVSCIMKRGCSYIVVTAACLVPI